MLPLTFFWINGFPPSTPGAGLSDTKGPRQLILGYKVHYKKVCRLHPGEYVQVHQEDEPPKKIDIDRTVGTIALGPQYNLQGGYFFESLLTGKRLRQSHWTPVNMTEDVIERYVTFNTKGCPEDLIFGVFNDQPIPYRYSDLKNDYDDDGTQIDSTLRGNKGVEDVVIIICEIIVGGWDGLIIKVTKNEVFWTTFGVKRVISFNDILIHVNRGPM